MRSTLNQAEKQGEDIARKHPLCNQDGRTGKENLGDGAVSHSKRLQQSYCGNVLEKHDQKA